MRNIKSVILYGFLIWLIPFVLSFFLFPLYQTDRIFFETLMTIILVLSVMLMLIRYSKINPIDTFREGLMVGTIWIALNIFFDAFVFIWGPLSRDSISYFKDIGLIYLIIPIITSTIGKIRNDIQKNSAQIPKQNT